MPEQKRLTPEMLVPRMGEYLVQKGLITEEQLQNALAHQQEETAKGNSVLLGQALLDLKYLERSDLDQAVTEQILHLRSALQSSNRTLERRVQERTEELQKALERVSELNQLKANFISNISHELRTPLTHIKGYVELLITESLGPITEEQRHALSVSQQSANKLTNLVEDLIMISLASRGELMVDAVGRAVNREPLHRYRSEQPGDVKITYACVDKARRMLGYAPATPLEVGLARYVEWLRSESPAHVAA